MLAAHNRLRSKHCAPPLVWSSELAATAQRWAHALRDRGCAFEHSRSPYGENLAFFAPVGSSDGPRMVRDWYDEVREYDFDNPGFGMNTGHFTQVVWRGTTKLGCASATCNQGELWVCNYDPPGNMQGAFPAHVKPIGCRE